MSAPEPRGPWSHEPAPPPPPRRGPGRLLAWAVLVAAVAAIALALARAYPEALRTRDDWTDLIYALGLVLLVSAGMLRAGRGGLSRHLKSAAAWTAIIAVTVVAAAFRDELASLPRRVALAFSDHEAVATADREVVVPQSDDGAYLLIAKVNGQRVRFVVDTGASDTVLAPADARRLGVDVDALEFGLHAETANGVVRGAPLIADLEVGPIRFDDFRMTVNEAPMTVSLLGMSFLRRLESFEFRGRNLILRWRDPKA